MQEFVTLSPHMPIASGQKRLVYAHPDDPTLLVKVVRPDIAAAYRRGETPWYKRLRRSGVYHGLIRELREYLSIQAQHPVGEPPVPPVVGWVKTDMGTGLLVHAMKDDTGKLAPTLGQLVRQTLPSQLAIYAALDAFRDELLQYNVIVNDLNLSNVVLVGAGTALQRLMLVDGFGEWNWIPRCSMSRWFNGVNTRRRFDTLVSQVRSRLATPAVASA